ncbi:hypothetical protein C8J57DRAFT_1249676 [Mycena rebaudengoi]|nr:hypothetical protein C8J57DRAFT_1249676 [Mycena rebaudengoi]
MCWTTHLVAVIRFEFLKGLICAIILNKQDKIIKAQVGVESNVCKRTALEEDAIRYCEMVESHAWWDRLSKIIIPDLEHICYLTNIFLLSLGGLFFHFHGFSACRTASERGLGLCMCKQIKKHFKELDQVVFVLALVLNPFEKLSRFGDKAQIDGFKLSEELIKVEFDAKQKEMVQVMNTAFMQYLSGTGPFKSWFAPDSEQQASYNSLHVTHFIQEEQRAERLMEERAGQKNHTDSHAKTLLSVPRDNEGRRTSVVVRTSAAWRKQVAAWQEAMHELDAITDEALAPAVSDNNENLPSGIPLPLQNPEPMHRRVPRSWFPTTLAMLFGGVIENPFTPARRGWVVSEEALLMELLAAEHSNKDPDAGAQEGSGDDYEG